MITWQVDGEAQFHRFDREGEYVHVSFDVFLTSGPIRRACNRLMSRTVASEDLPHHHYQCESNRENCDLFIDLFMLMHHYDLQQAQRPRVRQLMEASILV